MARTCVVIATNASAYAQELSHEELGLEITVHKKHSVGIFTSRFPAKL